MHPRNLGALALAAVLTLSACSSDDPEPKVAPTPSASSSSPPPLQPSPSAGGSPEDAVQAWVEARNDALRSGDTTAVRALSTENCKSCDGVLDSIDTVHEAGGRFETKGWFLKSHKLANATDDRAKVNAGIVIRGGRTYPSAGAEPVSYGLERSIVVFKLRNEGGDWRINFIGFLS